MDAPPPNVPLFDLRLEDSDIEAVVEVLRSGWLTMGPRTRALEEALAIHLDVRHVVAVSSGTAALHLAFKAAGVGPGDEVIVPAYTFVATANAILYCGAQPRFADIVALEDPTIDPSDVERLITPRTRAVAAVHFAGYPAAVEALAELCRERGLALIEDAAHAPDAERSGRKLGTFGLAGAFSFFSNKVLSVGEGGAVATNDDQVAEQVRRLRSHALTSTTWDRHLGHADTYDVVDIGFNYRIDEPRAALAVARLSRMATEIGRRRELTRAYRAELGDLPDLVFPFADAQVAHSSCYIMPLMLRAPERRAAFRTELRARGIQTSVLYPAIHEFSAYRQRYPDVTLPRTEEAARCEVTLPLYPHMTEEDQGRVLAAVREALEAD
jgi:dTDP-4-amino-4,6-dideoxygalactose transaminase